MNRSPQTRERRRNIADGALGLTCVSVAVYANLTSASEPSPYRVLDALRRYAEASDWTVRPDAVLYDMVSATTPREKRPAWPALAQLIEDRHVSGLIVPAISHLASGAAAQNSWRNWQDRNGIFVVVLPDVLTARTDS
ncbi:recombinase family protein [Streptomyces sp. NPDC047976]|uniref:recombinase family protein n=1 Tax=Streptomyces sp. NPDC047976 TaxID=3155746 RepID=UPI00341515C9